MKKIRLPSGHDVIVDDSDFELLKDRRLYIRKGTSSVYASIRYGGKTVSLHRFLLDALPGLEIDHKNGNSLDNRRSNLRFVSHHENMANQRKHRDSMNRFKGIRFIKKGSLWIARICVLGTTHYLGSFKQDTDAARAYDRAAKNYFGSLARLNFPISLPNDRGVLL